MNPAAERARRLAALPFETLTAGRGRTVNGFIAAAGEVVRNRRILGMLVRRELKARYKDSALGFLWTLVRPLTLFAIYFVAVGQFLGAARAIPDFGIFIFAGLTIWALYSEVVQAGTSSIISNASLIKKVSLLREVFPLAASGSALVNFAVQFAVLIAVVVALGQFPMSWELLYVPIGIVVVGVHALALALMLSALNVYFRDVQYLVEVVMMVLFWASPIVYSWSFVAEAADRLGLPWLRELYLANPVTVGVIAFQRGIWLAGSEERALADGTIVDGQPWPPDLDLRLAVVGAIGLVMLLIAHRVFRRLQGNFAQEI